MTRFRLSIRLALLATLLAAISCAALVHPSPVWTGVFLTLTAQAFLLAAFRALSPSSRRRAPYLGFLAGCLGYLALAYGPFFERPALNIRVARRMSEMEFVIVTREVQITPVGPRIRVGVFPPTRILEIARAWLRSDEERPSSALGDDETLDLGPGWLAYPTSYGTAGNSSPTALAILRQEEESFYYCGHILFSWLAGILGAAGGGIAGRVVGRWIGPRRTREQPASAAASADKDAER